MRPVRLSRVLLCALVGLVLTVTPGYCQGVDWNSALGDVRSPDKATYDAGVNRLLDEVIPKLCKQKASILAPEIPGLVDQLNRKEDVIRSQASGLFYMIGQCRTDSQVVFAKAIPDLIEHGRDPVQQVRANVLQALGALRPEVPDDVLSFLTLTMGSDDEAGVILSSYGVARRVTPGSKAEELFLKALSRKDSPARKKAALDAMADAHVTDAPLMAKLGDVLSDSDSSVVRTALIAMIHIGQPATAVNRERLRSLAGTSQDRELVSLANQLLERDASEAH